VVIGPHSSRGEQNLQAKPAQPLNVGCVDFQWLAATLDERGLQRHRLFETERGLENENLGHAQNSSHSSSAGAVAPKLAAIFCVIALGADGVGDV